MDLEIHPLQIKTKSAEGKTHIYLDRIRYYIRIDIVYLADLLTLQVRFPECRRNDKEVVLGSASKERMKIWTIATRRNNITINLNGMRVLNAEYINNCSSEYEITRVHFYEEGEKASEYRILEAGMHIDFPSHLHI